MATFTGYTPSANSTTYDEDAAVTRYEFGDGYSQRVGSGLNGVRRIWNVVFELLDDTDADAIIAFLRAQGGTAVFDWTPPHGAAGKWTCKAWHVVPGKTTRTISATFREEFDI